MKSFVWSRFTCLVRNDQYGQKWSSGQNDQKWSKMVKNGQKLFLETLQQRNAHLE